MKNILITLFLLLVFTKSYTQNKDSINPQHFVSFSIGPALVISPDSISDYWKAGYNFGISYGEKVSKWGYLIIQADYTHIFFNKRNYVNDYVKSYTGSNQDSIRSFANDTVPDNAPVRLLQLSLGIMINPFTFHKWTPYLNLGLNINFPLKNIYLPMQGQSNISYLDNTTDAGAGLMAAIGADYRWGEKINGFAELRYNHPLEKLLNKDQDQKMQWNIISLKIGVRKKF